MAILLPKKRSQVDNTDKTRNNKGKRIWSKEKKITSAEPQKVDNKQQANGRNSKKNIKMPMWRWSKTQKKASQVEDAPDFKLVTAGGGYRTALVRSDPSTRLVFDAKHNDGSTSEWRSCDQSYFHRYSPLLVKEYRPRKPGATTAMTKPRDAAAELGTVMARSRRLPGTWYYSSNHILVNKERLKHSVSPLVRKRELDEMARLQAGRMAKRCEVQHSEAKDLRQQLMGGAGRRLGENVASGSSIESIHREMMKTSLADKNNILDRRFTCMGMGTAKGSDGRLYMCQLFRV